MLSQGLLLLFSLFVPVSEDPAIGVAATCLSRGWNGCVALLIFFWLLHGATDAHRDANVAIPARTWLLAFFSIGAEIS